MIEVDKNKLVLVHNNEDNIVDAPLESKEIGYYHDSWNRFKKNKASFVAFIIICVIFFFILLGPYLKRYDLYERKPQEAQRIGNLPPKIPGLEKIGIFDGKKTITRGKKFLANMYHSEFGEGIILSGMPEALKLDEFAPEYDDVTSLTVKVDYYKYVNYIQSYIPEDFFSSSANSPGSADDPYGRVRRTLLQDDFDLYMEKNYIIDILAIKAIPDVSDPTKIYYQYEVRLDQFLISMDQLPEDTYFWFGTTALGQDLFTQLWIGARISLLMAISVLIINTLIGLTLGSIVGYYGGVLDLLFDRFVDIVASIPFLSVLILLTLRFGTGLWVIIIAFVATGWLGSYGTGRMQFYRFKNREYVLAARTLGASDARIMFKHIFPNTLGLIVTGYALAIPAFVFTESTYSFLGIINYSDATSVGMLIQQGQSVMQTYPHLLLFPSVYIAILMIAFNLFGNGLRDAFNPSLRGAE